MPCMILLLFVFIFCCRAWSRGVSYKLECWIDAIRQSSVCHMESNCRWLFAGLHTTGYMGGVWYWEHSTQVSGWQPHRRSHGVSCFYSPNPMKFEDGWVIFESYRVQALLGGYLVNCLLLNLVWCVTLSKIVQEKVWTAAFQVQMSVRVHVFEKLTILFLLGCWTFCSQTLDCCL